MKVGETLLDGTAKALQPCKHCGGIAAELHSHVGPHGNKIICAGCGKFLGWLPRRDPRSVQTWPDDPDDEPMELIE